MSDFLDLRHSEIQRVGLEWHAANAVYQQYPDKQLETLTFEGATFLATPAVVPANVISGKNSKGEGVPFKGTKAFDELNPEDQEVYQSSYRIATRLLKGDSQQANSHGNLMLVMDDNFLNHTYDLTENLGLVGANMQPLTDNGKHIEKILSLLKKAADAEAIERAKDRRVAKIVASTVGGIAVGITGIITFAVHTVRSDDERDRRHNAQVLEAQTAFDAAHIMLNTKSVGMDETGIVKSDPTFFQRYPNVPKPFKDDTYTSPRIVDVLEGGCESMFVLSNPTDKVRTITDAGSEVATILIDASGEVNLCTTAHSGVYGTTTEFIVQVVPADAEED